MIKSIAHSLIRNLGRTSIIPQRQYVAPNVAQIMALQQIDSCVDPPKRGLVLGVFANEEDETDEGLLSPSAWNYNVHKTDGCLLEKLRLAGQMPNPGETRIFYGVEIDKPPYYTAVAVVGLGKECIGYDPYEILDEQKEVIRRSVGKAVWDLLELKMSRIDTENCGHAESAAEGAYLGTFAYQDLKTTSKKIVEPVLDLYAPKGETCDLEGWKIGMQKASAQNLTRRLQEMPSNILTPTAFAQEVVEVLCRTGINVEVKVEGWAESQQMNSFLAVAKASCETPIFLELSYYGAKSDEKPIVLIGQGITFDSGGLCIKDFEELRNMRGDMTGAAVVVATMRAVSRLRLPVNIRGLIPLCENLVGCNSLRPGDILKASNGKNIKIQGTDHEDVLVLADALLYAQNFCPKFILDIGTTSGQMRQVLDEAACGIFTNSEILWQQIKHASMHTGDRVWRLPLWNYYSELVKYTQSADIGNYGIGRGGRPPKAAAFLREFVPCGQWMHVDAANVMTTNGSHFEYLRKGMAGRPTRTIVEFIAQTLCTNVAPKITTKK